MILCVIIFTYMAKNDYLELSSQGIPRFLSCCHFHLHPVTPLSFKSDNSRFVQNSFGVGPIFWGKKNWDQINNDVTVIFAVMSVKLIKRAYFKRVGLMGGIPHRLRIFQKRKEKIPHEIKDVKKSGSNQRP